MKKQKKKKKKEEKWKKERKKEREGKREVALFPPFLVSKVYRLIRRNPHAILPLLTHPSIIRLGSGTIRSVNRSRTFTVSLFQRESSRLVEGEGERERGRGRGDWLVYDRLRNRGWSN